MEDHLSTMQEPLNFSRSTAYSTNQELAARLLNSLKAGNCATSTNPTLNFDLRASSAPRVGVNDCGGESGGTDQVPYAFMSNTWTTFPSTAFLAAAAAAAAAISMKPTLLNNSTSRLRETMEVRTPPADYVHAYHEILVEEPKKDVFRNSAPIDSNTSKASAPGDVFTNHGSEGNMWLVIIFISMLITSLKKDWTTWQTSAVLIGQIPIDLS